jgi:hypothetical protein
VLEIGCFFGCAITMWEPSATVAILVAVDHNDITGEATDRDGVRVVLLARVWSEKVLQDHPELARHLPDLLRAVSARSRRTRSDVQDTEALLPARCRPELLAAGGRKL